MQRQDYVLKLIEQLGAFFRQVRRLREIGQTDEALMILVRAQESLMGKTAAEFSALSFGEQFQALTQGEKDTIACEKVCAYAALLRSMAEVYRQRGQDAVAEGAALLSDTMIGYAVDHFPDETRPTMERMAALQDSTEE